MMCQLFDRHRQSGKQRDEQEHCEVRQKRSPAHGMDGPNSMQLYRLEASWIRSSFAGNGLMFLVKERICDSTFLSKKKLAGVKRVTLW